MGSLEGGAGVPSYLTGSARIAVRCSHVISFVPTASIDALTALAHEEKNSSDETGEFFSMAAAVKVPAAQVPPNSVVIGTPDIGIEADMSFLFMTPFMFLRLHGIFLTGTAMSYLKKWKSLTFRLARCLSSRLSLITLSLVLRSSRVLFRHEYSQ
jgi:hypothetical protein